MAAEESSQAAALGPELSDPDEGPAPASRGIPNLHDVLGEFMEALCVVQMVHRVLQELSADECVEPVGACSIALGHGVKMLDAVYSRFDLGLLGYDDSVRESDSGHDDRPGGS